MKLIVLDQAPVPTKNTVEDAMQKAVELAVLVDKLGYSRIWMAEHHGSGAFFQFSSRSHCRRTFRA